MKIGYFVHDLADAAVHRRVRMLLEGGASVVPCGFRRSAEPVSTICGVPAIDLGRTEDARLIRRIITVLRARFRLHRLPAELRDVDLVMARQLEMLVLAAAFRDRYRRHVSLVFECLDIHGMMLKTSLPGRLLRWLEGWYLRRSALLVISSPGFVTHYFRKMHRQLPPVRLIENRPLKSEGASAPAHQRRVGAPPWRIGWFGVIRCARSLDLLARLVCALPGQVEIVIRGKPARNTMPDFDRIVATTPGLTFLGPYDRATQLADIYADVHFTWAIDYYEAGGNSDWLLPNRLYEGGLQGAVPIARAGTQTGAWLAAHRAGVLLDEPLEQSLPAAIAHMTNTAYQAVTTATCAVPIADLVYTSRDATDLVQELARLPGPGRTPA